MAADQTDDVFKDPLGVNKPLPDSDDGIASSGGGEEEAPDEFDLDYYISQIAPVSTKNSEHAAGTAGSSTSGGAASARAPVLDGYADSDEHDLIVVVDSPEKHITTMESYITFRVTTTTTRPEYDGSEIQVRRRYNDFLWLRQRLEETQPTYIIPPLPEKHSFKRMDRFNEEFIKTRRIALQTFLQRIADHPVLSFNKNVFAFLTAKLWVLASFLEFQAAKKEGTGLLSRWTDSFHNMSAAYMMKNRTPEFTEANAYIYLFGEKMAVLSRISQRIAKEQCDLLAELNEWGPIFTLWSNSEDRLSQALSAVAKSVERCYLALQGLVDATEAEFGNPLTEYVLYAEAIKVVLRKRDAIQMEYDLTLEELNRKKEEKDPGSEDMIKLNKQVETLNDRMSCANADLKADMDRWHRNKRTDFRKIFVSLADRQIEYYETCFQAWEEVIHKIQKADVDWEESSSSHASPKSTQDCPVQPDSL